jgi:TonB family protein
MRIRLYLALLLLVLPCSLVAQVQVVIPAAVPRAELGKWWKNSQIVKQLQLKESQVAQIEKIFMDYQNKLLSAKAELDKREWQMKTLMQSDQIQEAQAQKTIEQVAMARAELEKANASMMLSIRKTLSKEQWNKLDTIQNSQKMVMIKAASGPKTAAAGNLPAGLKQMTFNESVYSIGDSVKPPQVLDQPKPSYTQKARDARIEGVVLVSAVIQKDGTVGQIKVIKGLGYGLDENVVNTISKAWKFKPGTLNDKPVNVSVVMEVSFRLY